MYVYLQYANSKKNTNIVVHYITLANYGKTGWASVAMPILPSAIKDLQDLIFNLVGFFCAKKNAPKMHRPGLLVKIAYKCGCLPAFIIFT